MENFIGIDLGTTYSSIATLDEYGRPYIVKTGDGDTLIPSAVYITDRGDEIAGSEAKEIMQNGEENVAVFFKRHMGDKYMVVEYAGNEYTPTELSAILLRKIKEEAERGLKGKVNNAVITVPAYFNDLQRNETIRAAQKAGLNVLRIINEPTAAALTYGLNRISGDRGQNILVYDLGGGTFDVTVLKTSSRGIEVMSTGGDHQLGGKDWDDMLITHFAELFKQDFGIDILDSADVYNELAYKCEVLKKQLSEKNTASIVIRNCGKKAKYEISRQEFETMTDHLLRSTKLVTESVLSEAGLIWSQIDGVLLVGGSTRMPMVEDWVRQMSGKAPLHGVNVAEAVALGAAIQAGIEMHRSSYRFGGSAAQTQFKLLSGINIVDVMSHSLGTVAVSTDGMKYINSIIIPKNKPIPASESKPFQYKTRNTGENSLTVYLTQGESQEIAECSVVGKYIFSEIHYIGNNPTVIGIRYAYDENGLIQVSGLQTETGKELKVEKVPLEDDLDWLFEIPRQNSAQLSIILAIDLSGSMAGSPLQKAKEAAREFVRQFSGNGEDLGKTRIGIMGFADKARMACEISNDRKSIISGIDGLNICKVNGDVVGGGNLNNPLQDSYSEFQKNNVPKLSSKMILVVLTDGVWSYQKKAIQWSDRYREELMDIIAIGFGGADKNFLERISTSSENALLTDLDHLVESFGNIAQEISQTGGIGGLRWNR